MSGCTIVLRRLYDLTPESEVDFLPRPDPLACGAIKFLERRCATPPVFCEQISTTMAVSIGKRKRGSDPEADGDGLEDEGALRARFQRAFEAKFKPLERVEPIPSKADDEISDEEDEGADESDWSGLSDEAEAVVVVQHGSTEYDEQYSRRQDKKEFMVRIQNVKRHTCLTFSTVVQTAHVKGWQDCRYNETNGDIWR